MEETSQTLRSLGDRIAIIGPPKAGKTTLANRLHTRTGLPIYGTDHMAVDSDMSWIGVVPGIYEGVLVARHLVLSDFDSVIILEEPRQELNWRQRGMAKAVKTWIGRL